MKRLQLEVRGCKVDLEVHDQPEDGLNAPRFCEDLRKLLAEWWPCRAIVTLPDGRRGWCPLKVRPELWPQPPTHPAWQASGDPRTPTIMAELAVDKVQALARAGAL